MKICKPIRNPKKAIWLLCACAAAGISVGALACIVTAYKWAVQIAFIIIIAISIWTVVRYTLTEMEYAVGSGSFDVCKIVGNKRTEVCSLELSTAIALIPKEEFKKNQATFGTISKKFNFNQNIGAKSYIYVSEFNGKTITVEFEPNEIFVNIMKDEIDSAKKRRQEGFGDDGFLSL